MRRRLAIIGSGTMARGIAAGALGTGARVTLCSRSSSNAAEAWGDVRRRLEEAGCCGLSSTDIREALTRFEVTTDRRAACEDAELVLEEQPDDATARDLVRWREWAQRTFARHSTPTPGESVAPLCSSAAPTEHGEATRAEGDR